MKLTSEQLKLAQGCTSAEELLGKAKAEGFEMTLAQAESFLDSSAFTELDENSLDGVSGGCGTSEGYTCYGCKKHFYGEPNYYVDCDKIKPESHCYCDECFAKLNVTRQTAGI